jgi:hypothetical protein
VLFNVLSVAGWSTWATDEEVVEPKRSGMFESDDKGYRRWRT